MSEPETNRYAQRREAFLEKHGLSTFALKIIAMTTMLIDHVGIKFCGSFHALYMVLRSIGRLSFPIYCFVLVEGFFYTRNRRRYALRLGIFALISEIPYDIFGGSFFNPEKQNVMFTLLFGFLMIWAIDSIQNFPIHYPEKMIMVAGAKVWNTLLEIGAAALGICGAYFVNTVYTYAGVILILCFYLAHNRKVWQLVSNMLFNMGLYAFSIQWLGVASALPIAFYNKKPGAKKWKYLFYWFYPVHLLLLSAARMVLSYLIHHSPDLG